MNQIKLNKNSWHYKYYSQIVGPYTPKSLCPYFWSLIGLLIVSPLIVIIYYGGKFIENISEKIDTVLPKKKSSPSIGAPKIDWDEYFRKEDEKSAARKKFWDKIFSITTKIAQWVLLPIIILGVAYMIYLSGEKNGWLNLLIKVGIGLILILIIFGFVVLMEKVFNFLGKRSNKIWNVINPFGWTISKMIGGMIYAWYKKSCPLIEWEEDKQSKESYS